MLLGGAIERGGAITANNRATYIAETIGEVVTQSQNTISTEDMAAFIRTAAIVDPDIIVYAKATGTPLDRAVDVVVSSIAFEKKKSICTKDCDYNANVVFSAALSGTKRACGSLRPGSDGSPQTLPSEIYSANSIVEVKVHVHYRPKMTTILGSEIAFDRVMYFRPRYLDIVNSIDNCPAYPAP